MHLPRNAICVAFLYSDVISSTIQAISIQKFRCIPRGNKAFVCVFCMIFILVSRLIGVLTYFLCKMEMFVSKVGARGPARRLSDVTRTVLFLEL